jgi:hypothetical protein
MTTIMTMIMTMTAAARILMSNENQFLQPALSPAKSEGPLTTD